jgi:hypothetical protein
MAKNLFKLIDSLPLIEGDFDFKTDDFKMVKPYAFIRDGILCVSAENGDMAGDYYEDYINKNLVEWAEKQGGYFEWYDAGTLVFSV